MAEKTMVAHFGIIQSDGRTKEVCMSWKWGERLLSEAQEMKVCLPTDSKLGRYQSLMEFILHRGEQLGCKIRYSTGAQVDGEMNQMGNKVRIPLDRVPEGFGVQEAKSASSASKRSGSL
jgi:hypothetical protein